MTARVVTARRGPETLTTSVAATHHYIPNPDPYSSRELRDRLRRGFVPAVAVVAPAFDFVYPPTNQPLITPGLLQRANPAGDS